MKLSVIVPPKNMELHVTEIFQRGILKALFSNKALYCAFGIAEFLNSLISVVICTQNKISGNGFFHSQEEKLRPVLR
jgi:hypothetical protein